MLELEADSLEELGQTRRALNQYRKLRKGYPNYKSSRIESAIDRLEKRLEPDEPASGSAAPSSGK